MSPRIYLALFLLALCFLDSLELLWELPISTAKQMSIFLHSFPHHMVIQFTTDPTFQTPPNKLTQAHIAYSMKTILTNNIWKCPRQPAPYLYPPSFVASPDVPNYASDKHKPTLVPNLPWQYSCMPGIVSCGPLLV